MTWLDTNKRSSTFSRVGYEPAHLTLVLEFKAGGRYSYANVSPRDHSTFLAQPSLGHAFNQMFWGKPKLYPSTKLPEPTAQLQQPGGSR